MTSHSDFRPPLGLRGPHSQSVLSSGPIRRALLRARRPAFLDQAEEVVLNCGDDARLQGFYSAHPEAQGLVVLLHGWEGSVESTYMQDCSARLFAAGFAVFRLNFRDHGSSYHLNEGIFHSCRLDEVVAAVQQIGERYPSQPLLLAGYSLGGNFALRIANDAAAAGIALRHVMAVCPPISPRHSLEAIESAPWIYEHYFLKKWRASLRAKQQLFPHLYQFDRWLTGSLLETTARLVERFTEFSHVNDYFEAYSVAGNTLAEMSIPSTIVAANDDPVIPIKQFHELELPSTTELQITSQGGHCGFLDSWRLSSWISKHITNTFLGAIGVDSLDPGARRQPLSESP